MFVTVLVIGVLLVGAVALMAYWFDLGRINREGINLDELDGVGRPESNRPHDNNFNQGYYWDCCNHCYGENGELVHSLNILDNHTVPCNEENCQEW